MELSRKQYHICRFIKEQVSFWLASNDFNSPTNLSDTEECARVELEDILTPDEMEDVIKEIRKLYYFVSNFSDIC